MESTLGNFIADAMRLVTQEKIGNRVDFAVQANGSIRGSIFPGTEDYSLNRIAFYDIVEQVGLGSDPDGDPGYPIVSFYLNGKEISKVLEIAALLPEVFGNEFFFCSGRACCLPMIPKEPFFSISPLPASPPAFIPCRPQSGGLFQRGLADCR